MPKPGEPGRVPAVENILLACSGDTVHNQLLRKAGNRATTVNLCPILTQDSQHFLVVYPNACVPKNAQAGTVDAFDFVVRKDADLDACHNARVRSEENSFWASVSPISPLSVGLVAPHTGIGQGKVVSMLTRRPVLADSWQAFITSSTCKPCSGVINVGLPVKSASAT